jgi:hypothetical protein
MNIFETFKPFYLLSKVLGLFPMTLENSSFRKTKFDVVRAVVSWLFLASSTVLTIWLDKEPPLSSAVINKTWRVHSVFGLLLMWAEFSVQMWKCKAIPELIFKLHAFDEKVKPSMNQAES